LVTIEAEMHVAEDLSEQVCSDPDDDKFLACAMASGNKIIERGAKHLKHQFSISRTVFNFV